MTKDKGRMFVKYTILAMVHNVDLETFIAINVI